MEMLIEEAWNNNWFNFFVNFMNDEANYIFWPTWTYVEIWDIRPKLVGYGTLVRDAIDQPHQKALPSNKYKWSAVHMLVGKLE